MIATLAALLAAAAAACPNPQFLPHDGAVRVTATDLEVAGSTLGVRRALTSSLPFSGQFGAGFGLEEELSVERLATGALRVVVPGPCPACAAAVPEPSPEALVQSVALAARTLRASGVSGLAREASDYAAALAADPRYRLAEWEGRRDAWLRAARLEPADGLERLPVAARYRVVALPSGYLRYADGALVQELDAGGRLVRVVSAAGLVERLRRDEAGRLTGLEDGRGRSVSFELDAAGRVVRATGSDGSAATYGYDGAGHLAWCQGREGRTAYTWGPGDRLLGLEEAGRTTSITYEPPEQGGRVAGLVDSAGRGERFEYQGRAGGFSRAVTVYAAAAPGAGPEGPRRPGPRELRRYAYVEPLTADGRRWTWQESVEEDGELTVRTYDDRTFQPLVIAEGERVARFRYDELGRVVGKEVAGEVTALTYSPGGKVASLARRQGADAGGAWQTLVYAYDAAERLVSATGDEAAGRLEYDDHGRIAALTVVQGDRSRRLAFAYDERDKPARIEAEGLGAISVRYRPDGEIEAVDSEGGSRVALEVTAAFQALLALVRPAGLTLSAW